MDHCRPDQGWPFAGQVNFNSYSVRYREGLDLVLRDINCAIAGGEKVKHRTCIHVQLIN